MSSSREIKRKCSSSRGFVFLAMSLDFSRHVLKSCCAIGFSAELQKAKSKAQSNNNLREEANICNQLGDLLSRNGKLVIAKTAASWLIVIG